MDWHIPLVIAAAFFALFMVVRMRPRLRSRRSGKGLGAQLREAKKKVEAAKDSPARAEALAEAGDLSAALGRATGAVGYYLRAMREDPARPELVERAARGLARRPHSLESLLWRRLGAEPWDGGKRAAALAALTHLSALYAGPLKNRPRGRAVDHARAALSALPPSIPPPPPAPEKKAESSAAGSE